MTLDATEEQPEVEGYSSNDEDVGRDVTRGIRARLCTKMAKTAKHLFPIKASANLTPSQARMIYKLKLQGPVDTLTKVQKAAVLSKVAEVFRDEREDGRMAYRELLPTPIYITIEKDATLHNHRPQHSHFVKNTRGPLYYRLFPRLVNKDVSFGVR